MALDGPVRNPAETMEQCLEMKRVVITVVGSSNTDMVIQGTRIPAPGETCVGGRFFMAAGGKGANQAVAASRLGAEVHFVGAVGDDWLGRQALDGLRAEGIHIEHVHSRPGVPSGVALILVSRTGENAIAVAPGANETLTSSDIEAVAPLIRCSDLLLLQLEIPLDAVCAAARVARNAGVRVLLDPAPAPVHPLPRELIACVDLIKPNFVEAARLVGHEIQDRHDAATAAKELRAMGPNIVIITLGSDGVVVLADGEPEHVPAFPVNAVDTTAAGDAFAGALAVAWATGTNIRNAVRFAAAAGALAATKPGAQPSLPTRAEVELFLAARGNESSERRDLYP